jgi:hypothetical protein
MMFWDDHGHGYCYVLQRPNILALVLAFAEFGKSFNKEQAVICIMHSALMILHCISLIEFHMTLSK